MKILSRVGDLIRTIINSIIGGVAYIVGVGPVSLIGRLCRKEFMKMKRDPNATTYWEKAQPATTPSDYYRQF